VDKEEFDALARRLSASVTRRGALQSAIAVVAALLLADSKVEPADARRRKCRRSRRCGRRCCRAGQVCVTEEGARRCTSAAGNSDDDGGCFCCCRADQVCVEEAGVHRCAPAAGTCAVDPGSSCNGNIDCVCIRTIEGVTRCGLAPTELRSCGASTDCVSLGRDAFCADRGLKGSVCFRQCLGTTPPEGTCTAGDGSICNGSDVCRCFTSTEGNVRCGEPVPAFACTGSGTCVAELAEPAAFCTRRSEGSIGLCVGVCRG
jgi:hypothetical protein